jgi:subtilase family serine protease
MKSIRTKQMTLTLVAAISVVGSTTLTSNAQGVWRGAVYIPESTIERPQDIGVAAHTNHMINAMPMDGLGPEQGMTPAQMRSFYNMPASGGSGVIAIVDAYDYPDAISNFNTFSAEFGLPRETSANPTASSNKVLQVVYQGGIKPVQSVDWNQEEALDIQWAHAMAPSAKIVLVEAHSSGLSDLYASVDQAASFPGVKQVSMSWGGSETYSELELDVHFNKSGPIFLAASGDYGGATTYPGVSPYVLAVGGTTVNTNRYGVFESEFGWYDSGGGPSSFEKKPAWQVGVANTGVTRSIPDISANGDPNTGLSVYGPVQSWWGPASYTWMAVGGTSAATASMAGMLNLAGSTSSSTTALLKHIYSLVGSKDYRDITVGNNGFPCLKDWDFVTGVGTPLGTAGL